MEIQFSSPVIFWIFKISMGFLLLGLVTYLLTIMLILIFGVLKKEEWLEKLKDWADSMGMFPDPEWMILFAPIRMGWYVVSNIAKLVWWSLTELHYNLKGRYTKVVPYAASLVIILTAIVSIGGNRSSLAQNTPTDSITQSGEVIDLTDSLDEYSALEHAWSLGMLLGPVLICVVPIMLGYLFFSGVLTGNSDNSKTTGTVTTSSSGRNSHDQTERAIYEAEKWERKNRDRKKSWLEKEFDDFFRLF